MARPSKKPPTSDDVDRFDVELRHAGDREQIDQVCLEIGERLRASELPDHYWDFIEIGRKPKRNFAQRFSASLAQKAADALRPKLPGIYPDAAGRGHEWKVQGAEGLKKLDVSYATQQAGLRLSVSVKTVNFRDERTKRFTKNVKRVDGEMRAEASDCHKYNPYAVLAGIVVFPIEAATDGVGGRSSLKHAAEVFRRRAGRRESTDDGSLFELVYLGVYDSSLANFGSAAFFDVAADLPDLGLDLPLVPFSDVIGSIQNEYERRIKR